MDIKRPVCSLLASAILISGCVSTTLFRTTPEGSDVYVKGQRIGKTPYYYSDSKAAFSSTPVTFKKKGYTDLNIILKKDEGVNIGAFIGGLFMIFPFIWITKYDEKHTYELKRESATSNFDPVISNLNDTLKRYNDTVSVKHDSIAELTEATYLLAVIPDSIGPTEKDTLIYSDTASIIADQNKKNLTHFGFGGGFCFPGSVWGMDYTFLSSKDWGGSIRYNMNIFKSLTVPDDYYEDGNRTIAPKDYLISFSFNCVKAFSPANNTGRFAIEVGPSYVIYKKAEFELNPDYNSSDDNSSWWFSTYKYYKSHPGKGTIGLSLRADMEFPMRTGSGLELSAFTIINRFKTIFGLELDMIFGRIQYYKYSQ